MARAIKAKAKPKGYTGDSKFFTNPETGRDWKAKLVVNESSTIEGGAATQIAVTVTVSPVDANGKALTEDDRPIIIDSWTHTFNTAEMAAPDFDPQERILDIIDERVKAGEGRVEGVNKIRNLVTDWSK